MNTKGVAVTDECVNAFNKMKLSKDTKFIVFKLSDDKKQVEIDQTSTDGNWDNFTKALPANDGRFAVYDFQWDTKDGQRNKLTFVAWTPETAPTKSKMVYASTKDALKKKLVGLATEVQACGPDEITYNVVLEKVSNNVK